MFDEDKVICELAETCNTWRCKHNKAHEETDECEDHFCDKHMKELDCIEAEED